MLTQNVMKVRVAEKSMELLNQSNAKIVGLGTGSTASEFINKLIQDGRKDLTFVATSQISANMASRGNLKVVDLEMIERVDITFDGADLVTPEFVVIKGWGGAHTIEKKVAKLSDRLVLMIDETKLVDEIAYQRVPFEVEIQKKEQVTAEILKVGITAFEWRQDERQNLFITDGGNHILDSWMDVPAVQAEIIERELNEIDGIIDNGIFTIATDLIVCYANGTIDHIKRNFKK